MLTRIRDALVYGLAPIDAVLQETTARYTRVATGMIANIESPLDLLSQAPKKPGRSKRVQPSA